MSLRIFCCCCNPHKIQFYLTRLFVYLQVKPTRFFLFLVECNRNVISLRLGQNSCEFSYQMHTGCERRSRGEHNRTEGAAAEREVSQIVRRKTLMYWCGNSETSIGVRGSRGKAPKRRQWRKKRGAFEAAARLARPKERGNRFAATVDKPPRSWGSKGDILFNEENIPFDIAPRGAAKTAARRRREGACR